MLPNNGNVLRATEACNKPWWKCSMGNFILCVLPQWKVTCKANTTCGLSIHTAKVWRRAWESDQIRSVAQSCPTLTPWIAAHQASLSNTNSQSSLRLTSIESLMPSSHLILCRPLLLLPPIPPSIRVFSKESTLCMRWSKYWSFSFSIIPS